MKILCILILNLEVKHDFVTFYKLEYLLQTSKENSRKKNASVKIKCRLDLSHISIIYFFKEDQIYGGCFMSCCAIMTWEFPLFPCHFLEYFIEIENDFSNKTCSVRYGEKPWGHVTETGHKSPHKSPHIMISCHSIPTQMKNLQMCFHCHTV